MKTKCKHRYELVEYSCTSKYENTCTAFQCTECNTIKICITVSEMPVDIEIKTNNYAHNRDTGEGNKH